MANGSAMPHLLGHSVLILSGEAMDQTAGTLFFAATTSKLIWGHKDWGMQLSCLLSMMGIAVITVPAMANGDFWATATYATITIGLLYGFFGAGLDRKFSTNTHTLLRFILGKPRQRMGDCFLLSKPPTVIFAILSHNWPLLIAQFIYAAGDIMLKKSKVEARQ